MQKFIWLVGLIAALGCSSSAKPALEPTPMDGGGEEGAAVPDAGESDGTSDGSPEASDVFQHDIVLSMHLTVGPGEELHQCQFFALPNDADVNAIRISHAYTPGSHHFLIYITDLDTIPDDLTGQYDCTRGDEPVMMHAKGILYAAQTPRGDTPFPAQVGLPLKAHQVLMLMTHYLNPSTAPIAAKVSAGFDVGAPDQTPILAGFFIFYQPFIDLPPQAAATAGMRCNVPVDLTMITASTHYHQRGTGMRVWLDPSPGTPAPATFYETHDWEHSTSFEGPMPLPAGSAVRFQCDYMNTDVNEVFQGPNATTSEMCVFAGLYYPKVTVPFETCTGRSLLGTGTHNCSDQLTCIQGCPPEDTPHFTRAGVLVGPCWERCVASGCQGATDALLPATQCIGNNCQAECAAGNCNSCAIAKCLDQLTACYAQACP
jgi:hypothetical protein